MSGTAVGANLTSRFSRFPLHDNLRLVLLGIALGVPACDLHPFPAPALRAKWVERIST
jgi:hypothetical protein